jgi:hypothetical protein
VLVAGPDEKAEEEMHRLTLFAFLTAIGTVGCGGSSDGGAAAGGMGGYGVDIPAADSYYPQKVGNSWTYLVTPIEVELPSYKVVTVEAMELVGGNGASKGLPAYRHVTCKSAPSVEACGKPAGTDNRIDKTVGWMGMIGKTLGNYREQSFKKATDMLVEEDWWEPYRNKMDMSPEHLVMGATWHDQYREFKQPVGGVTTSTSQNETWTVVGVDETVTVTPPGGAPKDYPHCLKVTHTNNGGSMVKAFWYAKGIGKVKETGAQTEELLDYKVVP